MNPRRCNEYDYINFLVAVQKSYSCLTAGHVQPNKFGTPAHDALNRLLHRPEPHLDDWWREAEAPVRKEQSWLLWDDSTLDKPFAKRIGLVYWHWSGKHHNTVRGINLLTLLWTDGDKHIPCDHRLYDKPNDNLSKNDPGADLLTAGISAGLCGF